ncbi:hypothetical protein HHK36_006989 [Tetracentron sinense]|uniref:Uncharacterized protein n=1 Tax=Tetracentron sinense TaxID=13715 RepID=A0A835DPQ0_TETSI|nr:hypothetical protein HHK36_006989 [Tetracentron sinense]
MTSTMEQPPLSYRRQDELPLNLREWNLKAHISRENTKSRRFSAASNIRSFREETRPIRSNITISSTASSPGYNLRDEINPSTYSFTTALRALQVRSSNGWECLSPDGFALNSKWNEAEKYICNPLSGEVPMECLSAKTLSGRSFATLTGRRTTKSGPLFYPSHASLVQTKPTITQEDAIPSLIQEKKLESFTRDVGTQITPPDLSSSSPSPAATPPIQERSLKRCLIEGGESPNSDGKLKSEKEEWTIDMKEKREKEKATRKNEESRREEQVWKCMQGGCLSWRRLWTRKGQREKQKRKWQV